MKDNFTCRELEEELGDFTCFRCGKFLDSARIVFVWGYEMWVHKTCFDESENGWALGEERILKHLRKCHIEVPPKNDRGWLPRSYPTELKHSVRQQAH